MATLSIRSELFEQGLFPTIQTKLTQQLLINLFQNLNLVSSIDYKIRLKEWTEQAMKFIPGISEQDCQIYWLTYKALLDKIENPTSQMIASTSQGLLQDN